MVRFSGRGNHLMEKRALYNLLRVNWQEDPSLGVEPWQVEDYRNASIEELFERLKLCNIFLDKKSFLLYVNNCQDPEDLTDCLAEDLSDTFAQDQVYLLIFELWRKLAPHKRSLSIFCDALDRSIEKYDLEQIDMSYPIEDAMANLQALLENNGDKGIQPQQLFLSVSQRCAADLESFLYDFIADQIEAERHDYAGDLISGFFGYVRDKRWLRLLRAHHTFLIDPVLGDAKMQEVFEDLTNTPDLDFHFEALDFILHTEQLKYFLPACKLVLPLLDKEDYFRELLNEIASFLRDSGKGAEEKVLREIVEKRGDISLEDPIDSTDPDLQKAIEVIGSIVS